MRKIRSEEPANQSIYEDSQKDTANLKIKNVKTLDELNKMQDSVDKQDTGAIKIQDDIHQLNNGLEKAKANELQKFDNIDMIKTAGSKTSNNVNLQSLMQIQNSYHQVLGQIDTEVNQFSTTLNPNHLYQAIFLQGEINDNKDLTQVGYKAPNIEVHTVEAFKKSFTFPQIALNDFAVTQLQNLSE